MSSKHPDAASTFLTFADDHIQHKIQHLLFIPGNQTEKWVIPYEMDTFF